MADISGKGGRVVSYAQGEDFFFRRGQKHILNGDYINALVSYHKLLEINPDETQYLMDVAWLYAQQGYYALSNRFLFRQLNRMDCERDLVLNALGCNYYALCEYTCAEKCLNLSLAFNADSDLREDTESLLSSLEEYRNDPDQLGFPPKYQELHDCYYAQITDGKSRSFPQLLGLALSSGGDPDCAPLQYAVLLAATGEWKESRRLLDMLLGNDPENYRAMAVYAVLLRRKSKHWEAAEPWLEKLAHIETEFDDEEFCAAAALYEYDRYPQAIDLLERLDCTQVDGQLADQLLALACYGDGQYAKAQRIWEDMERMMPWDGVSRYYARLAAAAAGGEPRKKKLEMTADVPDNEAAARMKAVGGFALGSEDRRRECWEDSTSREALTWLASQWNQPLSFAGCKMMLETRGKDAFPFVRDRFFDPARSDFFRQQLTELLTRYGFTESVCYMSFDSLTTMWVPQVQHEEMQSLSPSQSHVFFMAVEALHTRLEKDVSRELAALWKRMCGREKLVPKAVTHPEVWALGLEYAYLSTKTEIMDRPEDMAPRFNLSPEAARRVCDKILKDGVLQDDAAD